MSYRHIEPFSENLALHGAAARSQTLMPNTLTEPEPIIEWVDPGTLLVDDIYQRDLTRSSTNLIRKILGGWSWRKFKPPVVAKNQNGDLVIIDGQHTSIAAATHPDVKLIPVLIVPADTVASQADAFLGHNRDRLQVSKLQQFHSAVVAGDSEEVEIAHVCKLSGVTVLKNPPGVGRWPTGSTIAVDAIRSMIRHRGRADSRRVLSILTNAQAAPIYFNQIKAVQALLFDREFKGAALDATIAETIRRLGTDADKDSRVFAATHGIPQWKALTIVYFKAMRRHRAA